MIPSLDFLRILFGSDVCIKIDKDQPNQPKLLASETNLFSCYFSPLTVFCKRQILSKGQNTVIIQASGNILLCS